LTTVAWDGHTLAGDRLTSYGGTPMRCSSPKVSKVVAPNGRVALVGFTGSLAFQVEYLAWLNGGDRPTVKVPENTGWSVLMVDDELNVWLRSDGSDVWTLLGNRVKWAAGSGCDYALGAMATGATAEEAVHVSTHYDIHTGMGVDAVRFE